MSAHLRHVWQRRPARHLLNLLATWQPRTGRAVQRQQRVVQRLTQDLDRLPAPVEPQRLGRHAALPEVRGRAA